MPIALVLSLHDFNIRLMLQFTSEKLAQSLAKVQTLFDNNSMWNMADRPADAVKRMRTDSGPKITDLFTSGLHGQS